MLSIISPALSNFVALARNIARIQQRSESVSTAIKNNSPSPKGITMDVEAISSLRVKSVVWQQLRNSADANLNGDPIDGIRGVQSYHEALANVVQWGRTLIEMTLKGAELMNVHEMEATATKNAKSRLTDLQNMLTSAKSSGAVQDSALRDVTEEVLDVQIEASRIVTEYCRSFYYNNLRDCSHSKYIKVSDQIPQIREKLAGLVRSSVESLAGMARDAPQPFNAHHVLIDKDTTNCADPVRCPVQQLRTQKSLLLDIPEDSTNFAGLERVRVNEVRIFMQGVAFRSASKSRVTVFLDNTGDGQDRYNDTSIEFVATPRNFMFTMDYRTNQTLNYACVHQSFSPLFNAVPPFGKWVLTIHDPSNTLNLDNVSRVELYFIGSATKGDIYRPSVSGNMFSLLGEANRSPQCAGAGRILLKKRSALRMPKKHKII